MLLVFDFSTLSISRRRARFVYVRWCSYKHSVASWNNMHSVLSRRLRAFLNWTSNVWCRWSNPEPSNLPYGQINWWLNTGNRGGIKSDNFNDLHILEEISMRSFNYEFDLNFGFPRHPYIQQINPPRRVRTIFCFRNSLATMTSFMSSCCMWFVSRALSCGRSSPLISFKWRAKIVVKMWQIVVPTLADGRGN